MSRMIYGYAKITRVHRVIDGDTLIASLDNKIRNPKRPDTAFLRIVTHQISVRLSGIDAPELNDTDQRQAELANLAKAALEQAVKEGERFELQRIQRDKYFRLNAILMIDDVCINEWLLDCGLAKRYGNLFAVKPRSVFIPSEVDPPDQPDD